VGGWPQNHEYLFFFERAEVFRRAFNEGDYFPLWSPFGFNGHGAPLPFFYHRLNPTFVAFLSIITNSVYWAVKFSVPILLVVGALGIERLTRCLGISTPFRIAAGLLLMFASYTLTNWFVRGAMAEFTASMLLPWLFYYGLLVIHEGRGRLGLGITFALLFYSHSVIFFYSIFYLIFLSICSICERIKDWKPTSIKLIRLFSPTFVIVFVFCGPYALAIVLLAKWFNIRSFQEGVYHPTRQFRAILRYIFDINFAWGAQWDYYSVEIGRAFIIAMCIIAGIAAAKKIDLEMKKLLPLVLLGVFFLYLQTPASSIFYKYFPGASFIQFPWRLLAFLTPIAIVLLVHLGEKCLPSSRVPVISVVLIAVLYQVVFGVRAQVINYDRFSKSFIERRLGQPEFGWPFGEFLPRDLKNQSVPPPVEFLRIAGCEMVRKSPERDLTRVLHFRRIQLELVARNSCAVYFSQFATPFIHVELEGGGIVERASDGTTVVRPAPGGPRRVTFLVRGLFETLLYALVVMPPTSP